MLKAAQQYGMFTKSFRTHRFVTNIMRIGTYIFLCKGRIITRLPDIHSASVEQREGFLKHGKRPGNETEGWHGTRRGCLLGNDGCVAFCDSTACSLCAIIKTSFDVAYGASGLGFGLGWEMCARYRNRLDLAIQNFTDWAKGYILPPRLRSKQL